DEEESAENDKDEKKTNDAKAGDAGNNAKPEPMRVDTDGLTSRQYVLPIEPGNYSNLEALYGSICYLARASRGMLDEVWPPNPLGDADGTLHRYELSKEKEQDKTLAEKIPSYVVDRKCDRLAYP